MAGVIDLGVGYVVSISIGITLFVLGHHPVFQAMPDWAFQIFFWGTFAACTLGSMFFTHVLCLKYGV
jgi:hypothetical protein